MCSRGASFWPLQSITEPYSGGDFRVGIGEQFEVEAFFRAKVFVRLRGVHAHSKNDYAGIGVF